MLCSVFYLVPQSIALKASCVRALQAIPADALEIPVDFLDLMTVDKLSFLARQRTKVYYSKTFN